jgi:D-xylose transport system substrate-binding protein
MKNKLYITGAFLIAIFMVSGCQKKADVKIGFSVGPSHERWEKDIDYFSARIRNAGASVFVHEAQDCHETQVAQVGELLKKKIDVLVIVPVDSRRAAELVRLAHGNNVRVIAYDRIIHNCDLDFYISFDNMRVGEMQAEYLTRIRPSGKYAVLGGDPADNNSRQLRLGQMHILQPLVENKSISIVVDELVKNWSSDEAYSLIDKYLEANPGGLDAIVASNDHLAEGAYNALVKHNMVRKVLLSGQDAEARACHRIARGNQTMTVYKYIETLATVSASTALSLAKGDPVMNTQLSVNNGKIMVPSILLSSMVAVHPENIRMTVIADGYLNENLVFGMNFP